MDQDQKIKQRSVLKSNSLIDALKVMDATEFKSLLVVDEGGLFCGILSIGDIQRAIIGNLSLETAISEVLRKNPRVALEDTVVGQIKDEMLRFRMEFIPVIDHTNNIKGIYLWEELFLDRKLPPLKQFNLPVVIMAGGVGSRLKPLTNVLPKPLIPIGEKTIIEEIFERFYNHGCDNFFVSVNYKADLIEFYLRNQDLPYNLNFFKEEKPLGTAGSLSMLNGIINETIFVSNCDILIGQDYSEILDYHRTNHNEITIVAALKHFPLAYGIIKTGKNGRLIEIEEKPELAFKINSGMYVIEPHLLKEIPKSKFFHLTSLIELLLTRNGKIGVFPISESSWKDIGNWDDYQRNILNI